MAGTLAVRGYFSKTDPLHTSRNMTTLLNLFLVGGTEWRLGFPHVITMALNPQRHRRRLSITNLSLHCRHSYRNVYRKKYEQEKRIHWPWGHFKSQDHSGKQLRVFKNPRIIIVSFFYQVLAKLLYNISETILVLNRPYVSCKIYLQTSEPQRLWRPLLQHKTIFKINMAYLP